MCTLQVLYAVALVPAGFLADRTDRPRMLAGGLGVWSLLTMAASKVSTARELLLFLEMQSACPQAALCSVLIKAQGGLVCAAAGRHHSEACQAADASLGIRLRGLAWTCWSEGGSLQVTSFRELLALRIGFAAAQSTQNPICFSLIPELFPKQRTFAMAAYNSAIYMGRALSFAAVVIAGQLGVTQSTSQDVGVQLVRPFYGAS